MNNFKRSILSSAIAVSCVTAYANDAKPLAVEEVVVTAQKRSQSLQDVPIAVQAVTADTMRQNGISTLSDMSSISPGFKIADTQSTFKVSALRGVNSYGFGFGVEESIPFYLDGIYLGNGFEMLGDLLDIRQVEVLKGPQGTLFGRNASGGAVNVITNKPSDELEAEVSLGVGNYGLLTRRALVNVPIIDNTLMVRGGISTRDRDGWQTNVITGKKDGSGQDRMSGFVRALWVAADNLEVEYSRDWSKQDDHSGYTSVNAINPSSPIWAAVWSQAHPASFYNEKNNDNASGNAGFILPIGGGLPVRPAAAAPDIVQNRKITGDAVKLTWDINSDLTLTSISSLREVDARVGSDLDGSNLGLANSWKTGSTKEINQELRLNGMTESLDWLVGFNYYKQDREEWNTTYLSSLIGLNRIGPAGAANNVTESSGGDNETESYSLFSDATWHVTEALNLTAGIRYSYDKKTFDYADPQNTSYNNGGILYPNHSQLADPSVSSWDDNWSNVSGRIGTDYALDENILLYATISQGYKSGGFNTRLTVEGDPVNGFTTPDFATDPFDEETNINYEVGIKSDLLDRRLRFNSSIFMYVYKDLQTLLADGNSPVARTVNAAEVTGKGWETELTYLATERLTISANVLALNAEYTEDVRDAQGLLRIEEGTSRTWSPELAATLSLDYSVEMADMGELRANMTYTYQDEHYQRPTQVTDPYSDSDNEQEAYGLLNARVSYYSPERKWEVGVWGKNLLDESYRSYISASVNAVAGVLTTQRGEPTTFGVEAIYHF